MKKTILFLLIVLTLFMFAAGFRGEAASGFNQEESFVQLQKDKQITTMKDITYTANAIRLYIIDHHKAPEAKTFAELRPILSPRYIKILSLKDTWGNDLHYHHGTGDKKYEYAIGSGGKDGVFNGWDQSGFYLMKTVRDFDNDIILVNGRIDYGPVTKPGHIKPPPPPRTFEGKLKATMSNMHFIGRALGSYIEDYNQVPQANSIKELSIILQPFYIKTLPLADAWGNEFLYKVDTGEPGKYWVGSPGSNGKFKGFDQKGTWKFEAGEKGQDIVLANGDFTYKPDLEENKKYEK